MAEVERTSPSPVPPPEMLRDLARCQARPGEPDHAEAELMRLSADPLLLRALLCRQEPSGFPAVLRRGPLMMPPHREPVAVHSHDGRHLYHSAGPELESSLRPEAFHASEEDRREAIAGGGDIVCPAGGAQVRWIGLAAAVTVLLVTGLLVILA